MFCLCFLLFGWLIVWLVVYVCFFVCLLACFFVCLQFVYNGKLGLPLGSSSFLGSRFGKLGGLE